MLGKEEKVDFKCGIKLTYPHRRGKLRKSYIVDHWGGLLNDERNKKR